MNQTTAGHTVAPTSAKAELGSLGPHRLHHQGVRLAGSRQSGLRTTGREAILLAGMKRSLAEMGGVATMSL